MLFCYIDKKFSFINICVRNLIFLVIKKHIWKCIYIFKTNNYYDRYLKKNEIKIFSLTSKELFTIIIIFLHYHSNIKYYDNPITARLAQWLKWSQRSLPTRQVLFVDWNPTLCDSQVLIWVWVFIVSILCMSIKSPMAQKVKYIRNAGVVFWTQKKILFFIMFSIK